MNLGEAFYRIESGARPILLPRAARLFEDGRTIFLDARSGERFALGQIDGALSVPADLWQDLSADVLPWIEGQKVVVYADREAIDPADDLAGSILARGLPRDSVFIYIGGVEEWRAAGLPVREGASSVLSPEEELTSPTESEPELAR
jgi:rhodanese-related sulfurtransferase